MHLCTVTGKSLAHFFSNFSWPPWGSGTNFGTGRFCEMESFNCLIFSKEISLTVSELHFTKSTSSKFGPPSPGEPQKKFEKKCARLLPVTVKQVLCKVIGFHVLFISTLHVIMAVREDHKWGTLPLGTLPCSFTLVPICHTQKIIRWIYVKSTLLECTKKLKADGPCLRDYPHTPYGYRFSHLL